MPEHCARRSTIDLYLGAKRRQQTMPRISRSNSMTKRIELIYIPLCLALLPVFLLHNAASHAQAPGKSPRTDSTDPASLPAHDSHQGLLIAADPYSSAGRYKERFAKH